MGDKLEQKTLLENYATDLCRKLQKVTEILNDQYGRVCSQTCNSNISESIEKCNGEVAFVISGVLDVDRFKELEKLYDKLYLQFRDESNPTNIIDCNVYDIDMNEGE